MKRLADYQLTKNEILNIFGSQEKYERDLEWYAKKKNSNTEKYDVACLLFMRGERDESLKIIESIENESYRQTCLEAYAGWGAPEGVVVN